MFLAVGLVVGCQFRVVSQTKMRYEMLTDLFLFNWGEGVVDVVHSEDTALL